MSQLGNELEEPLRPFPTTTSIAADDSLLWVAVLLADDRWVRGGEDRDPTLFYDTMVEVIDWKRNRVIGSERFDEVLRWVQPGLLGHVVVSPTGTVRYRTDRVRLASSVK